MSGGGAGAAKGVNRAGCEKAQPVQGAALQDGRAWHILFPKSIAPEYLFCLIYCGADSPHKLVAMILARALS
ncbi:hypothetical protein AB5I41_01570 [Sphingomonas sp. MMS24-JH45]